MKKILFVCTGNTCRSPMAEALLKYKSEAVHVKSAGLFAYEGCPANEHAIEALKEKGISCDHRSRQVNGELLRWADLVLTMTEGHKQTLLSQFPEHDKKIHTFKRYINIDDDSADIVDPFGGSLDTYRETLAELEALIDQLIEKIEKERE